MRHADTRIPIMIACGHGLRAFHLLTAGPTDSVTMQHGIDVVLIRGLPSRLSNTLECDFVLHCSRQTDDRWGATEVVKAGAQPRAPCFHHGEWLAPKASVSG